MAISGAADPLDVADDVMAGSAAETAELRRLVDEMAELRAVIAEQRAEQRQQQEEIAALRERAERAERMAERTVQPRTRRAAKPHGAGRRSLLKWAGAAAAATAVSVLATERPALAANGDPITAGNTTTASATTMLQAIGGSGASPLFFVDNSSATNASGLWGYGSPGFSGVYGQGAGSASRGVYGVSDSGYGVLAASITGIDIYAFGTGRIQQFLQSAAGAPTSGTFNAGEQIRDSLGDLYICVTGGTSGTWKKVTAIPAGTSGGGLVFFPTPYRIFSTRPNSGAPLGQSTPMTSGQIFTMQITGTVSPSNSALVVPAGATGIIGDLLAANGTGIGFLTLQPHSNSATNFSYLHYSSAIVVHNCVTIGLSSDGKLDVGNYQSQADVILDLTGYII